MERPCLPSSLINRLASKTALFVLACSLIYTAVPNDSSAWELTKEHNDIKVFTRKVNGSSFKEYKGIMNVKASLSSLVALVDDISVCPEWIHTCKEGKVLKRISPTESYTYTINDAPWPVSDRDAIVHNVISQDQETLVVTISIMGAADFVPQKPGLVRVQKLKGYWRFTPLQNELVEVVYQVHNDPGGDLPAWLVNSAVVSQPYHTLLNMKKMVEEHEYRKENYEFIQEGVKSLVDP